MISYIYIYIVKLFLYIHSLLLGGFGRFWRVGFMISAERERERLSLYFLARRQPHHELMITKNQAYGWMKDLKEH